MRIEVHLAAPLRYERDRVVGRQARSLLSSRLERIARRLTYGERRLLNIIVEDDVSRPFDASDTVQPGGSGDQTETTLGSRDETPARQIGR